MNFIKQLRFVLFMVFFAGNIYGQSSILEKKISVNFENITIEEALKSIYVAENISFSYVSGLSDLNKKITLVKKDERLEIILKLLFEETNIQFIEINNNIIIKAKKQNKQHTISGSIEDSCTGEHLFSANIYDAGSLKGTISNYYGFYSLTLPEGPVKITFSYVGYNPVTIGLDLSKDTVVNPKLNPQFELKEVIIRSDRNNNVLNNQMGKIEMSAMQTKNLPVFLGEPDIMKTIQLLPGIKGGTECSSGTYVRGGGPDQNLILLDGVPVYNVNHLFGFFSVFNSDAIQSFSVMKGGFPSRYGGRLSSVIDIKMKEGNNKKFQGEALIGLVTAKLTLEGPLFNENTSFIITGRRTYLDFVSKIYKIFQDTATMTQDERIPGYHFYDLNAKINHQFNNRNRLYYSIYTGQDKYSNETEYQQGSKTSLMSLSWWNFTNALRWNCVINDNLFSNVTLTYSKYNSYILQEDVSYFKYSSGINDWGGKIDFDYIPLPEHFVKFGSSFIYHIYNPGIEAYRDNESVGDTVIGDREINGHEYHFYAEDDFKITKRLKINAGIHFSGFSVREKNYYSVEPRISARYLLTPDLSLKASVVKMNQYIHLLTTSNIGLPTDIWVPATDHIQPQKSWQYSVGAAYNFNDKYEISLEGYYKPMRNLIEYKEGVSYFSIKKDWENKVSSGAGWAKGIELLINKNAGKITGWIGYTLAFTDRQFEDINFGQKYPYKYDRRHDVSIALTYKKSEKFDFGITWIYGTGYAITLPEKRYAQFTGPTYFYTGQRVDPVNVGTIDYIRGRNSYRMPAYHRLDIGFNFHKQKRWGLRTISFGLYNVYNRLNPFYLDFADRTGGRKVIQQSLFPVIPFISYSIKF